MDGWMDGCVSGWVSELVNGELNDPKGTDVFRLFVCFLYRIMKHV